MGKNGNSFQIEQVKLLLNAVKDAIGNKKCKWEEILEKPETYPPSAHDHNDLYYRKEESDEKYQPKGSSAGGGSNTFMREFPLSESDLETYKYGACLVHLCTVHQNKNLTNFGIVWLILNTPSNFYYRGLGLENGPCYLGITVPSFNNPFALSTGDDDYASTLYYKDTVDGIEIWWAITDIYPDDYEHSGAPNISITQLTKTDDGMPATITEGDQDNIFFSNADWSEFKSGITTTKFKQIKSSMPEAGIYSGIVNGHAAGAYGHGLNEEYGSIKFSNGVLICYGGIRDTADTIYWDTYFKDVHYAVFVTTEGSAGTDLYVKKRTTTGVTLSKNLVDGTVLLFAIGRWK